MTSATACALGVLACALNAACASSGTMRSTSPEPERGHKSYVLPVVEIVVMDAAVNLGGRLALEPAHYEVTPASIRRNLRGPWIEDDDPFVINQFLHPYQGAMYHGIARSNGLGYWPSMAYTFGASALWEIAGEATPPARNDQIASGIAGSFLGEPLFRISRLLLDRADHGPGVWRTLGSMLASPPTGLNHVLVGDPAGSLPSDAVPFSDIRVQFGATGNRPHLALSMDHGYPGNGYRHERAFDYFRIESRISADGLEQLASRGLLVGTDYGTGRLSGIWGVYGTYDYFAPEAIQFSSTALAVGATLQARIVESVVVQSSGLVGAGYSAARPGAQTDGRDYHYGVAPQALANLRLIAGRRAALDLTAREYFVDSSRFGRADRDRIVVGDASFAVRVYRQHGIGLTYQFTDHRPDDRTAVGVFYTFLGSGGFGVVQ